MNPNHLREYKRIDISTASSEMLLLMLYDGAIEFINRAKANIMEGRMPEKRAFLSKTIVVITELMDSLDKGIGGEIAENLERLYLYMNEQLLKANLNNDPALLDEVILLLTTLRDGWRRAINNQGSKQAIERGRAVVCR